MMRPVYILLSLLLLTNLFLAPPSEAKSSELCPTLTSPVDESGLEQWQSLVNEGQEICLTAERLLRAEHYPRINDYLYSAQLARESGYKYIEASVFLKNFKTTNPATEAWIAEEIPLLDRMYKELYFKASQRVAVANYRFRRGLR